VGALPSRLVLVGHPVAQSLSPTFQNAALRAAGIDAAYETRDVHPDDLASTMAQFVAEGVAGNATVPHKEALYALCRRRTPTAERVRAVNTFWVEHGELIGDNTDVGGFDEAVRAAFGATATFPRVALIGAGGAAAAVLAAVERWPGCQIAVASRTPARAKALVARYAGARVAASVTEALEGATLVVNASPLGFRADDAPPCAVADIPEQACVYDLVYAKGETAWVRAARANGHRAADGLGMLVAQGALAFERWFGRSPDRDAMWAAVRG
jgi:shikimate dehydrogenase